jgi:hypothetical protein
MIFDIETDGLLDEATKIHVMAYTTKTGAVKFTHDYDNMRDLLSSAKVLIGHNIICFDIPAIEKLLGIKVKAKLVDTLALSWYLNHDKIRHGLEPYGEYYGVEKPKIADWANLTRQEYAHRCVEDVKINKLLWEDLKIKLLSLYNTKEEADRLISYLSFKMSCVRLQERNKWKLDVGLAKETLYQLQEVEEETINLLKTHMPKVPKYVAKTRPAKPFKKDGSWSTHGANWFNLLRKNNLPADYLGEVKVLVAEEEPNPGSHEQVKEWLFSLGWKPKTFKYDKNPDGTDRLIPQVRVDGEDGKELCSSVLKLVDKEPAIKVLDKLSVVQHRITIFKGFLDNEKDGWITASVGGLTNTLRFKHRVLVNLPGVNKPLGDKVRGCLTAPEGYILCGSDMTSLEDTTKKHYMWDFDPEYVKEMSTPGFDPHLDLAKFAKVVTTKEVSDYVNKVEGSKDLKPIRKQYKVANYACVYGVGAGKLARETGLSVTEARKLIDSYWARNWSVRAVCDTIIIKTVDGQAWLQNPISKFWYSLRNEKDIFSTLNQGTGVYCFDTWIKFFLKKTDTLVGQFHDEIILCIPNGTEEDYKELLEWAMDETNKKLNLNVKLGIDIQFGKRYSEIH